MIKILIGFLIILLSQICQSHPTITEYYDINDVNTLSSLELDRSRFEISLQSNLQIAEYGRFDFTHPMNGRSLRIAGVLVPRDIEVYLRILSSPILHSSPYTFTPPNDERLMRHLGIVKGSIRLSQTGPAYKMIEKILKNHVASLLHIKDFHKPKNSWPTYLDNRAAYTNLWKHATNLFTVKITQYHKQIYYLIDGEVYVFKYHIYFDKVKFQDFALLLGYWNFDKIGIPDYLIKEFELEINHVYRTNYPKEFFEKLEDLEYDLNNNRLYSRYFKNMRTKSKYGSFNLDLSQQSDRSYSYNYKNTGSEHGSISGMDSQDYFKIFDKTNEAKSGFGVHDQEKIFEKVYEGHPENDFFSNQDNNYYGFNHYTQFKHPENNIYDIMFTDWTGGLSWEEAMRIESERIAKVLIKILYKTTRNMMKSHNIDVSLIQKDRIKLYRASYYTKPIKRMKNQINNFRLLNYRFDDVMLDEDVEEILFESGSKYKMYWNLKNDSLYNRRTIADKTAQEIDQGLLDILLFEPTKFYNKLINISGDTIDFKQIYDVLLALSQDTTEYINKNPLSKINTSYEFFNGNVYGSYIRYADNKGKSRKVEGYVEKVLEQYRNLPPRTNKLLRGRAKCLMAFLYLFGVCDTKGVVNFPNGWPRNIKKAMALLIGGMSSPCGLCNTLLGFLASIGFPPVSNNIYSWETRKNEDETTVYQLISGNLYSSFLRQKGNFESKKRNKNPAEDLKFPKMNKNKEKQAKEEKENLAEESLENAKYINKNISSKYTENKENTNNNNKEKEKNKNKDKEQGEKKEDTTENTRRDNNNTHGNETPKVDPSLLETVGVVDRSGFDLPLLCYLSGSYKGDELASLAYSYYIHSGIGNPTRTCNKSAQSSINRSPKNVGMMCLDAIPYAIEAAKSSMKNKHDHVYDASEEYKSKRYAEFIKKLSHMGDSDGLRMMGDFYYTGHEEGGIIRNYQQAINFWARAAENGDASSALAMAHHHLSNMAGDESGTSAMMAERYLRMVLNTSSPATSSFSTANFYLNRHGLGQPRDSSLAARYLRESADRGDVNSMVLMGHAYAGILTDVTPPEGRNIFMSFYYYRRAAQSGNIVGLFNSAVFTLHGYDLEYTNALDRCNEAYKLFSRVARMGTMPTVLKVLSKRSKHYNDKIGYVLMNMMLSELGDSNAHRELTKHFKTNSVFCYTEHLDPDITPPTTLYSSKNMSNSTNPITFKNFEIFQNLQKKIVALESMESYVESVLPTNSTLGYMGVNDLEGGTSSTYVNNMTSNSGGSNSTTGSSYSNTANMNNMSNRYSGLDRQEAHRMSREIRMLNMVRVTEMPDEPEPDLRTRGTWSRDEPHNVSIFESLLRSSNIYKDAYITEIDDSDEDNNNNKDKEKEENKNKNKENKDKEETKTKENKQDITKEDKLEETEIKEEYKQDNKAGSCYYYYSRRGAYSPQNSTPLLLAEALLSGRPWLPSEALFWAKRSKESDSLKGSYMYATMLEVGLGAPKNCQASFRIFKEFMSSKSRGERILGLVCILRNRLISKLRHPQFLYSFLVRLLYDSYAHDNLSSESYTPCDYAFFELDDLPPSGVRILSFLYMILTLFTTYVYLKITR